MAVAGRIDSETSPEEPTNVCPKCGEQMILEDEKYICPHCAVNIDYFGDEEDEL
jgi:transposase